jgi:prophage antirepressor-like protein
MTVVEVEPSPQRENNQASTVQLFDFKGAEVRLVEIEGAPWFVASDIRYALGIRQGGTNLKSLGDDEKQVIRKSGSTTFKGHGLSVISESGLYKLVMRSDKPEAKGFQDWVTKVVLPAIRQDGGRYSRRSQQNTPLIGGCSGGPW